MTKKLRVRQFIHFIKICCPKKISHFSKINEKNYIIIYILLDIKPFWVQYWSNRFNIFYTMCLKNKFFTKCCNFYLFLTLNIPQKRLILPFPPRPLFNVIKKFHWNTVKAIRPLKNANF